MALAWCIAVPASAWQTPAQAVRSQQPPFDLPVGPPPVMVQAPVAVAGSSQPPWMAPQSERIWSPGNLAREVSVEAPVIELPRPTFMTPPGAPANGIATGTLVEVPPGAGDGCVIMPPDNSRERHGFFARCFGPGIEEGGEMLSDLRFDYGNFYSGRSLLWLGAGIGVAGILANTSIDQNFRNWYQNDVRSATSDHIHNDIAWLGNGGIMLPIFLGTGFLATPFEDYSPVAHTIGMYGRRATRGFLVGGPMLLALQYGLGAHRPSAELDSHWHPFKDSHGASGDAWIGAVTFMTAAKMTDSRLAKVALYSLALVPAWGRIDVDQHYLSQVVLGVWLGYLSVEAVDATERSKQINMVPFVNSAGSGMGFEFKW